MPLLGNPAVPILTYHQVGRFHSGAVARQRGNYADTERFRAQVRLLRRLGYHAVTLRQVGQWLAGAAKLPSRPVAFTFDDAYANVFEHAAPALREAGWPATAFVVTREIGGRNTWDLSKGIAPTELMSAEQLRALASLGWEIGAHSRTHPRLPSCDRSRLRLEVAGARDDLADLLGAPPVAWCYPYGEAGEAVTAAVREAGFETAVTLRPGVARRSSDAWLLPRVHVGYRVGAAQLLWRVETARLRRT